MAIDYKGSKCMDCGLLTDALSVYEFHHRDPSLKEFKVFILWTKKFDWDLVKKEIDKCDLLCANCHRIRHWNDGNG